MTVTAFNNIREAYLDYCRQNQDNLTTWANEYQIAHKCVSRLQSEAILFNLRKIQDTIKHEKPRLLEAFEMFFDHRTREEWLRTYLLPVEANLQRTIHSITSSRET